MVEQKVAKKYTQQTLTGVFGRGDARGDLTGARPDEDRARCTIGADNVQQNQRNHNMIAGGEGTKQIVVEALDGNGENLDQDGKEDDSDIEFLLETRVESSSVKLETTEAGLIVQSPSIEETKPDTIKSEIIKSEETIIPNTIKKEPSESLEPSKVADPEVSCPICGLNLDALTISERTVHVDDCFNFGILGETDFELTTKTGYIYKSMKPKTLETQVPKRNLDQDSNLDAPKKPKREKNPIPQLKIMEFKNEANEIVTKLSMDLFCYKKHDEINHYFLSHFHSDHYMGITKGWNNGQIYCSAITKKLLIMKFKVNPSIITEMEFDIPILVPDTNIQVTLLTLNHCPGGAIFLFDNLLTTQKILHCGDFRVNSKMIRALEGVKIDTCYLDTTYLNPTYAFPKQEHIISVTSDFCKRLVDGEYNGRKLQKRVTDFFDNTFLHKNRKNYLICIGTYTIGKEKIAVDIALKLGMKLYANLGKRDILSTFDWEELQNLITDDPFLTQVHLIPMRYLDNDSLESYFQPYKNHFQNIIAFKPTGWSFISNNSTKWMKGLSKTEILNKICLDDSIDSQFSLPKIERQFKSDKIIQLYSVPYSEHSSFRELSYFCSLLDINRVIPTVNTHNLESIREMEEWISEWKLLHEQQLLSINLF